MSNTAASDLAVREPTPAELERVLYLFSNVRLPAEARLLAEARSLPVERFIAAVGWWPEGTVGRFQITARTGVDPALVGGLLLDRLAEHARLAGMATIQCASPVAEDNPWFGILRNNGFDCLHTERAFEVSYQDAWNRVQRLHQRHGSEIPAGWRTDSIRNHPPETALALIGAHRLLPPAEVRDYWEMHGGFDLNLSCLLFDGPRACGAVLARRMGDVYYVDVRVMRETNPRLRSLGNLFMMHRMFLLHQEALRAGVDVPIRWLRFRSGEIEHRETANLARRMGGRELAQSCILSRTL
jgi:hypothetical protein